MKLLGAEYTLQLANGVVTNLQEPYNTFMDKIPQHVFDMQQVTGLSDNNKSSEEQRKVAQKFQRPV